MTTPAVVELVFAAHQAQDAGLTVTELHTSWLDTPPEEAVIQTRVGTEKEAERSEQVNDAVNRVWTRFAATATNRHCASKTSRS